MKRLILLACVLTACRTVPAGVPVGAANPRSAVEQMLAGAKAQDLQAISAVWGDESGLARDHIARDEVEQRTFIMACVLKSDTQKVGEPSPDGRGRYLVTADLTQGRNSGAITFQVARTKDQRFLVANFDVSVLQNKGFCARPGR